MKAVIDIHRHKNKTVIKYASDGCELHDKVFETLCSNGIEEEKATDCANWCKLAEDQESYNEEDFDVYMEEPDNPSNESVLLD